MFGQAKGVQVKQEIHCSKFMTLQQGLQAIQRRSCPPGPSSGKLPRLVACLVSPVTPDQSHQKLDVNHAGTDGIALCQTDAADELLLLLLLLLLDWRLSSCRCDHAPKYS